MHLIEYKSVEKRYKQCRGRTSGRINTDGLNLIFSKMFLRADLRRPEFLNFPKKYQPQKCLKTDQILEKEQFNATISSKMDIDDKNCY